MFFEPMYIPWTLNMGTSIQQGDLFLKLFCRPTQELVLTTANAGKIGRVFGKNAGEWTGR